MPSLSKYNILFTEWVYVRLCLHANMTVFHANCTCMNGPVSEERSIFLHVPAVSCSMHPWNLEYSLLLQAKNMQNVWQAKTHPAYVDAVTCKWQKASQIRASCSWCKQRCKNTSFNLAQLKYLVDPFETRYLTRVYLLFQPWPHTHSLYRHAGLEKERDREWSGMCQSLTATFPPSTGCTFFHDYPGSKMTTLFLKNKPSGETIWITIYWKLLQTKWLWDDWFSWIESKWSMSQHKQKTWSFKLKCVCVLVWESLSKKECMWLNL